MEIKIQSYGIYEQEDEPLSIHTHIRPERRSRSGTEKKTEQETDSIHGEYKQIERVEDLFL